MWRYALVLLLCANTFATERIRFDQLSLHQGLSASVVYSVIQDRYGYIWVGTEDGLNFYDAYTFKVYSHVHGDQFSLSSSLISCVYEDRTGTLWIGTEGEGLNRFDRVSGRFFNYRKKERHAGSISSNLIRAIYETSDGVLWIGTVGGGLNRFDRRRGTFTSYYFINPKATPGNIANSVRCMLEDRGGRLWIGTATGLFLYDRAEDRVMPINAGSKFHIWAMAEDERGKIWLGLMDDGLLQFDPESRAFTPVQKLGNYDVTKVTFTSLYFDSEGKHWYGTQNQGLYLYDTRTGTVENFLHNPQNPRSIANNNVRCVYRDRSGRLWIGTFGSGLSVYDPHKEPFVTTRDDPTSGVNLSSNLVRAIIEDRAGRVWVGTLDAGVNCYDPASRAWRVYRHNPRDPSSIPSDIIYSLFEDSRGKVWVGTHGEGACVIDPANGRVLRLQKSLGMDESGKSDIWAINEDTQGRIWLASNGYGVIVYDPVTQSVRRLFHDPNRPGSLSSNRVTNVYKDRQGRLWIGTMDGGLNRYDPATDSFKAYKHNPGARTTISSNGVYPIIQDHRGRFWIGTYGDGLNLFDPETEQFLVFTIRDGLPNDTIVGLLEDHRGDIWIASDRGLSRFEPVKRVFHNYDVRDGLQSNEFYLGACFQNSKGELFFGGPGGYNKFKPDEIKDNPYKPPVVFTSFVVAGSVEKANLFLAHSYGKSLDTPIILTYRENSVAFDFSALNYTQPEKNQYAYRLEGLDSEWNYCGSRRHATYNNLSAGDYVLRIKASNNSGVWNEAGLAVRFKVTAPPWKTWWAYSLYTLAVFGAGYGAVRWRLGVLKRRNQELERMVALRTREISAQKNELFTRNQEIERQRDEIECKNGQIVDSIEYARRVQNAIVPSHEELLSGIKEYFVIYQPKDIVSGDFYWFYQTPERLLYAVGDCTGHGVPGALLSIVGNTLLSQIVIEKQETNPGKILTHLHAAVRRSLKQRGVQQDGMDIALVSIDIDRKFLEYAGARRPLYYVDSSERLHVVKGERRSIGGGRCEQGHFSTHRLEVGKGLMLYLTTDGYADQPDRDGKRLGSVKVRQLLEKISAYAMSLQQRTLLEELARHSRGAPQRDDVTIMGLRLRPLPK